MDAVGDERSGDACVFRGLDPLLDLVGQESGGDVIPFCSLVPVGANLQVVEHGLDHVQLRAPLLLSLHLDRLV